MLKTGDIDLDACQIYIYTCTRMVRDDRCPRFIRRDPIAFPGFPIRGIPLQSDNLLPYSTYSLLTCLNKLPVAEVDDRGDSEVTHPDHQHIHFARGIPPKFE